MGLSLTRVDQWNDVRLVVLVFRKKIEWEKLISISRVNGCGKLRNPRKVSANLVTKGKTLLCAVWNSRVLISFQECLSKSNDEADLVCRRRRYPIHVLVNSKQESVSFVDHVSVVVLSFAQSSMICRKLVFEKSQPVSSWRKFSLSFAKGLPDRQSNVNMRKRRSTRYQK